MAGKNQRLGPLQQDVLDYVWDSGTCTVRQCLEQLNDSGTKQYAYTTIQTVFDILHKKGLVSRRRYKNAYQYTARQTKSSYLSNKLAELISLFGKAASPVASSLVDALEDTDAAEIESLIKELKNRGHIK